MSTQTDLIVGDKVFVEPGYWPRDTNFSGPEVGLLVSPEPCIEEFKITKDGIGPFYIIAIYEEIGAKGAALLELRSGSNLVIPILFSLDKLKRKILSIDFKVNNATSRFDL